MIDEPLLAQAVAEPAVHTNERGTTQSPPSAVEEQVADDVFSREQQEAVAVLMAAQMGIGLLHHLAVETFTKPTETPRVPPRLPDGKRPDEVP